MGRGLVAAVVIVRWGGAKLRQKCIVKSTRQMVRSGVMALRGHHRHGDRL